MFQQRKSMRLKGWYYSTPGLYFVTVVTRDREHIFGSIIDGQVIEHECGVIARGCWNEIKDHFSYALMDEFIIMPNHIHGIVEIMDVGAGHARTSAFVIGYYWFIQVRSHKSN